MPALCRTLAVLAGVLAPSPAQPAVPAVHRLEPELLDPSVLARLPGRVLEGLDLGLHPSVPLRATLERGRRSTEFTIDSEPKLGVGRLQLPALLNARLRHDGGRSRPVRFELATTPDASLRLANHYGNLARLGRCELLFVDLDQDGAFGAGTDGYLCKAPGQQHWADRQGRIDLRQMTEPIALDGGMRWFELDPAGFELTVHDREPERSRWRTDEYQAALVLLNGLRRRLGHAPLTLDPPLGRACELHALYCAVNGAVLTHVQEPGRPEYSREGAESGRRSELAYGTSMRSAVTLWLHSFYHRIRMLSPGLTAVGMGSVRGIAALDTGARFQSVDFRPFSWPVDGAVDVPRHWSAGEAPSPLGDAEFSSEVAVRWGYPITLTFPSPLVREVAVSLSCAGKPLDAFVSSPEQPGNRMFPDNACSILVMARAPLPAGAECRVSFRCVHAGAPFARTLAFRTRRE